MSTTHLLNKPPTYLLTKLSEVIDKLSELYKDFSFHKAEEMRAKVQSRQDFSHETQSQIERIAFGLALPNTIAILEIESQIKSLTDEKFFIKLLLDHASSSE